MTATIGPASDPSQVRSWENMPLALCGSAGAPPADSASSCSCPPWLTQLGLLPGAESLLSTPVSAECLIVLSHPNSNTRGRALWVDKLADLLVCISHKRGTHKQVSKFGNPKSKRLYVGVGVAEYSEVLSKALCANGQQTSSRST